MPYLIAIYQPNPKGKGIKLVDIMKVIQYETLQECKIACDGEYDRDKRDHAEAVEKYLDEMKSFVLDETTADTEPLEPKKYYYSYVPEWYTEKQVADMP